MIFSYITNDQHLTIPLFQYDSFRYLNLNVTAAYVLSITLLPTNKYDMIYQYPGKTMDVIFWWKEVKLPMK